MATNNYGTNIATQFGMPLYGMSSTKPFTGNVFFVNETTGSDGNTGGPQDPFATLSQAHTMCTANNNDVVYVTGSVHTTATTVWSKARTHLIGLSPDLVTNNRARISGTGTTVFTPLVSVTATECIIENIGAFHGFTNATAQVCWAEAGGHNSYKNCFFGGMGTATGSAAQAASRSLTVDKLGENQFVNCQIGLDTALRSTTNASLEFLNRTPRNTFRNCIFPVWTNTGGAMMVSAPAASIDRWALFDNCAFISAIESTGTAVAAAIIADAGAGGAVLLNNPIFLGCTAAATTGPVYGNAGAIGATTSFIAIKLT